MSYYEKTKITFHNYFDLENFEIIKNKKNFKENYKKIRNYYNNKYGESSSNNLDDEIKKVNHVTTELKNKEIVSIKMYGSDDTRHILQFNYDEYSGNSSIEEFNLAPFKSKLKINIYKDSLKFPIKNESDYKDFMKQRITQELISYIDKIKDDSSKNSIKSNIHLFIPMKLNEQYSIQLSSESSLPLDKKRKMQQSNIHKLLKEVIQNIITSESQYISAINNIIEPTWLNINLDIDSDELVNKIFAKNTHTYNNDEIKFFLFFAKYIYDTNALFKKLDDLQDTIVDINKFKIKYKFIDSQPLTESQIFDKNRKIDFKNEKFTVDGKDITFKEREITLKKKDILSVKQYDNKDMGKTFLEITQTELNEGIIYSVKLFSKDKTSNVFEKPIYSVLKKKQESSKNNKQSYEFLFPEQLNPSTKSRSNLFLFINNFSFERNHVYHYYNEQKKINKELEELTFIIDLFTISKNMEDFYKYCLIHDKKSFQNTILNNDDNSKTIKTIELIINLLLKKKRLIAKSPGTKELSKFQNQIDKITVSSIPSTIDGKIIVTSVNINIIPKELKDNKDPFESFDGKKKNCKEKKEILFGFFKKNFSNKLQNTFKLAGITLKQYVKNARKKGGKKNTKKKNKRRKKYTRKVNNYKT